MNMPDIVFLTPPVLLALAVLPVLWFLLRVIPPPAKKVILPTAHFLKGLIAKEKTPARTPWWILLLRLLTAALVIIALARPVLNPSETLPGGKHLRLVIDNSWAAAQNWNTQQKTLASLLLQARRAQKILYILPTAAPPGQAQTQQYGPLSYTQAEAIIKGLQVQPWSANYGKISRMLKEKTEKESLYTIWLGHGIDEKEAQTLAGTLQNQGGLTYYTPEKQHLPLLLSMDETEKNTLVITSAGAHNYDYPLSVHGLDENGRLLDSEKLTLKKGEQKTTHKLATLSPKTVQLRLSYQNSAGATVLLDKHFSQKTVGIVAPAEDTDGTAFIDAHYYLNRALEPYAKIEQGAVNALIEKDISLMIMPDTGNLPLATLNKLDEWVNKGGVLLRFAGPKMAQSEPFLTPVPLRKEKRVLDGSLTWDSPSSLAPFPKHSPFYDLALPEDIEIKQQILAQPGTELEEKTWIALEDGTPLVTAAPKENGFLILVHTSATPTWSNLPISGLYVSMLKRIIDLADAPQKMEETRTDILEPLRIINGKGNLGAPPAYVHAIPAKDRDNIEISSTHPPGLYGKGAYHYALNLGDQIKYLGLFTPSDSVDQRSYDVSKEKELMPALLTLAFLLFLIDWLVMMLMMSGGRLLRTKMATFILCSLISTQACANDPLYAAKTHLAYIKTGDYTLDKTTEKGLQNLTSTLTNRTSIDMGDVVALDPDIDALAFFPIIYWPVTKTQKPLSMNAVLTIRHYLTHGGTIFFDTRDQHNKVDENKISFLAQTSQARTLKELTAPLDIAPLAPIPDTHVLSRSFYLLDDYPGYYTGGTLWIEENSPAYQDGVSSVIIGANDFAKAWAAGEDGSREQEMVFRFGVNLVVHALTGNYKEDQIHLPHILKRLGE